MLRRWQKLGGDANIPAPIFAHDRSNCPCLLVLPPHFVHFGISLRLPIPSPDQHDGCVSKQQERLHLADGKLADVPMFGNL